jgi:hypothetical protein
MAHAYYNLTYVNTTVVLNQNQSAHVVEELGLYVSNSSINQYLQNRDAIGLNLSYWQQILYTKTLSEHIVSPKYGVYHFEFFPGPLTRADNGGYATLTMNYYVFNVTNVANIAPRKFEYTFNSSVFNFEHVASGQVLPYNTRLNIILPKGSQIISVYPLPDYPQPNLINNYYNVTYLSWNSGELLAKFSLVYVSTETLQKEVVTYFSNMYESYKVELALLILVALAAISYYAYRKFTEL